MGSRLRQRTRLRKKSAWMSASWKKSARPKANIWPPRSRKRPRRRRNSRRDAAQRNLRALLAQEHVLAQARRSFCSPGALAGGHARRTGRAAGIIRHCGGQGFPRTSHYRQSSAVAISRPSAYVEALRGAKVLGAAEREQAIRKALDAATRTIPGARWREDKPLVATVVNLTEFPSVILGSFDPEFLDLPEEVLVTVMRDHQKYFAVEDANGKLLPHFLAVLNTADDSDGLIRHGNERVLRARFNDARFFWQTDQKQTLRQRVDLLRHVTFQKDLGSYYDKTMRVQHMASWLSEMVKQSGMAIRPGVVHKAALMAKTDLTTELVKEFTELQGIVGGLYARVQQLDEDLKPDVQRQFRAPSTITTSPSRWRTMFPRPSRARFFRLPTKPIRLRECLRSA